MTRKHAGSTMRWVYPQDIQKQWNGENFEKSVIPELISLGCQKYTRAYPLSSHHNYGYEFVYLDQGSVTWEINGVLYATSAGEWFFTFPGELHKARFDYMEPSRIWWIILKDPDKDPNWFRLNEQERKFITARVRDLPRVFRAGHCVREQFARLKSTLETESTAKQLFARHQVLDILLGLLQPAGSKAIDPGFKEAIIGVVGKMAQSPENRFTVKEMAQMVQISESHFYKLFHEIFGLSPAAYLERMRMERACDLLKTGMPITEVSFELGFKTSQHFSTVFKKLIGSSPNEWRKGQIKS